MAKNNYLIYVPGLADHKMIGKEFLLKLWRNMGLGGEIYNMNWYEDRSFAPKLDGLVDRIDELNEQGYTVSLLGVSAGASAALNAYVKRKDSVHKVVFVCGKLANFQNINPKYFINNPPFKESIELAKRSLNQLTPGDKTKMISMQPLIDGIVYIPDTMIEGVRNKRFLGIGHVPSIAIALVFYSRFIVGFIKAG